MKTLDIMRRTIIAVFAWLALSQIAQAVSPAPDGAYPGSNTAEGRNTLLSLNINAGTFNTAVGWSSLRSNVEGQFNTAIGAGTLAANTVGGNTAIGVAALFSNATGTDNTALGLLALFHNTTGHDNVATGTEALFGNSEGNFNTAYGSFALSTNLTGVYNTATGFNALAISTGSDNTADGAYALAENFDGIQNTAIGGQALSHNGGGNFNTAVGYQALLANNMGSTNTAVGVGALVNNTSGSNNIALGFGAGSNITTASDTICIGAAGVDVTDGCYMGHIFQEAIDPDNLPVAIDLHGKVGTMASSRRFKDDIQPMDKASEAILALKPVTFHYKNDQKCSPRFGLIAEDVAKVDPNLVALDKEGKPYSVRYDQVNAMLLNEFLKAHRKIVEQQKQIDTLAARLEEQTKVIQQVRMEMNTQGSFASVVTSTK